MLNVANNAIAVIVSAQRVPATASTTSASGASLSARTSHATEDTAAIATST